MCWVNYTNTSWNPVFIPLDNGTELEIAVWATCTITVEQFQELLQCWIASKGDVDPNVTVPDECSHDSFDLTADWTVTSTTPTNCIYIEYNEDVVQDAGWVPITVTLIGADLLGNKTIKVRPWCDRKIELKCTTITGANVAGVAASANVYIEMRN